MKNTITLEHQLTQIPITFCYTNKAYTKYIKKFHKLDNEYIEYGGVCIRLERDNTGKSHIVIGVNKYDDIYVLKAMLVHEFSHCVTMLMEYSKINDDEYRSYTLQWLYLEIMPFLDSLLKAK